MSPKHSRSWNVIQNIFAGYILFRNIYEIIKYILLGKYTIFPFIFPSRRENKGENRNVHNRNFWLFVKILKKICQQKIFVNMKVCAKGCCVQKNFFVCNNMSEHNVRSETKQCYACVWSHKKKLGNFCCSIVHWTLIRTNLAKLITSKRCGLLTSWCMLVIIFWIIQKTYHVAYIMMERVGSQTPYGLY